MLDLNIKILPKNPSRSILVGEKASEIRLENADHPRLRRIGIVNLRFIFASTLPSYGNIELGNVMEVEG
ncbi:MAG: hypothetical protein DRN68_04630 [Thaumarchaeota archaeon]|nr:MAG: hypothetical protein DRN68_04630 [Nitrososphaerota archaeon]